MKQYKEAFLQGICTKAYEFLGCHPLEEGYIFRVFAPNAERISVVGDFNLWDENAAFMKNTGDGIWEIYVKDAKKYDNYKYCIRNNGIFYKSDPYAFHTATRPDTASKVYSLEEFLWTDAEFFAAKKEKDYLSGPMNIYEVHLGSWKKYADGNYFSYRKLAEELVPYVKEMGYTHIEIMPVSEYPFDPSWGYQVTGYYAPTARYGTPLDFAFFVDVCHREGIGVILDWVGAHFPKDAHGLYEFDGTCLYEYADPLKKEHPDWDTRIFDYGKKEVMSFLISNIVFWMDKYHIDGFRVDAVASMLYLDYGRRGKEWRPNQYGGNQNIEAIHFLRMLCSSAFDENSAVIMIAEESTAFPMITMPPYVGGLGFSFKWNMGWMNDMLSYMAADPLFRKGMHNYLTFSMTYAFSENFILPLSHDEVVYGKRSMIEKMPGDYHEKFRNLRLFYAFMMAHPGKKHMFMGNEFAQFSEWDHTKGLDWMLLDYPMHKNMQTFVRDLNAFYLDNRPLWENDKDWEGFSWLVHDDASQSVVAFRRTDRIGNNIIIICNFCPVCRMDYRIGMPESGTYKMVLGTEERCYGGDGEFRKIVITDEVPYHGQTQSASFILPPLSALYYQKTENDFTVNS